MGAAASISNSASIAVQSGATLNVTAVAGGYVVPSAQTLSGNGALLGSAQINGILAPGAPLGGLTFSGGVTLAGATLISVNKTNGAAANNWAAVNGILTYGGALIVTNTGGTLAAGDTFPVFSAASYSGGFSSLTLPPLVPGLHWATNQLAANGTLAVAAPAPPQILSVSLSSTNLQLSLQSESGVSYVLQKAGALEAPITWTAISTNNGTGSLLTIPVLLDTTQPQQFLRLVAY